MSYDIAYHYQDVVRARDPEGLTAQFARPARPGSNTHFNNRVHAADFRMYEFLFHCFVMSELSRPLPASQRSRREGDVEMPLAILDSGEYSGCSPSHGSG